MASWSQHQGGQRECLHEGRKYHQYMHDVGSATLVGRGVGVGLTLDGILKELNFLGAKFEELCDDRY